MTAEEIAARLSAEFAVLKAWGEVVTTRVRDDVHAELLTQAARERFFRIRPEPRVKALDALIEKGRRPGKNYADPYSEITDRVGTRFVVLLLPEIQIVKQAVEHCDIWSSSLDRDFEEERTRQPLLFQYQSVHYVVRANQDIESAAGVIPEGTPCEVQIRTLLQHAYSELSHDTVYKPTLRSSPPEVVREVARSMALIETTDMAFERASQMVRAREEALRSDLAVLADQYFRATGVRSEDDLALALTVLDSLRTLRPKELTPAIEQFRTTHAFLGQTVEQRRNKNHLYRQAIVFLLYYLIDRYRSTILDLWPLPADDLSPLFVDLGVAPR